jgi:predicted Zn-dependent protease
VETEIITPYVESQTIDDIREIEDEQRIHYTVADDIAIFIYFSHAQASTDSEISVTLGTAYRNTSVVIYQQTIREVSISQNSDLYVLEETTLQHEIGHLFGLVNILEDDIHSEHEDLAHRKHCKVESCLMYFETNLPGSFRNRINVPSLDSLCIEDLQAKGGK